MKKCPTDLLLRRALLPLLAALCLNICVPLTAEAAEAALTAGAAEAALTAETAGACATNARPCATDSLRPDSLRSAPPQLPDSTVRRLARSLGMVDTAEVAPRLRRLEHIERELLPNVDTAMLARQNPRYLRHRARSFRHWARLIPNQATLQYAGSIGLMSAGIGWHYGREHWETDLLVGIVPRYHSEHAKTSFTMKQRYVPWHVRISSRWTVQPLTAGVFFNTISGDDFWRRQPDKYPKHYYGFSTKLRSHVFLGQRLRYNIPSRHRVINSAVSAYYELSSCDLYLVSKAVNRDYPWSRTLSLAFGLRWEM